MELRVAEAVENIEGAKKDAEQAKLAAESERHERVKLEALVAPRRLSPEQQQQIGDAVRKFAGQSVVVESYGLDIEGAVLGAQIIAALAYGNLSVVDRANRIQSGGFHLGVVRGPVGELTSSFRDALKNIGKLQTFVNSSTSARAGAAISGRAEMSGAATLSGGGGTCRPQLLQVGQSPFLSALSHPS